MACDLCRNLPLRTVRMLDEDIRKGDQSLLQLSTSYGTSAAAIDEHSSSCVDRVAGTGYELLDQMLQDLNDAAAGRQREYADNSLNADAMDQYIALMREARATILAREKLRPSEEMVREIIQKILRPSVNQCVVISVEESNRLREDIQSFVDPSNVRKVDRSVKQYLKRMASRLRKDTSELVPKLQRLLNVDARVDLEDNDANPNISTPIPDEEIN